MLEGPHRDGCAGPMRYSVPLPASPYSSVPLDTAPAESFRRDARVIGIGNGVFHPADFAILYANVAARRLGHVYSTHGIGGNLGYSVAPIVSFGLASAFGWRAALAAVGVIGVVMLGVLLTQRAYLGSNRASEAHPLALAVAAGPAPPLLPPLLAAMGFAVGTTGPSRDLIVRSATPKERRDASMVLSIPVSTSAARSDRSCSASCSTTAWRAARSC